MSVHQHGGSWKVFWRDEWGRQHSRSFGAATGPEAEERRRQAEAFDHDVRAAKLRRQQLSPPGSTCPTFSELLARYLDARKNELSPRTIREIAALLLHHAIPVLGHLPADQITMLHWLEIQERLAGRKPATINVCLAYLKGVLNWAAEHEIIEANALAKAKRLRTAELDVQPPSDQEVIRLMAWAPGHLEWAIEVLWHTGLRPGQTELLSLRWEQVDWEQCGIWIYASKTRQSMGWRLHPVPESFLPRLREMYERRDSEWLVSFRGRRVRSLKTAWRQAKTDADIDPRVRLYDIRHRYGTNLMLQGVDPKTGARLMRHKSTDMLMKYYYRLPTDAERRAVARLPMLSRPVILFSQAPAKADPASEKE